MDRLERIFGKPADYEIRRAAPLLFLLVGLGISVGILVPIFRLILEHVVTGPHAGTEIILLGFAAIPVFGIIGAIVGAIIGSRINRTASPAQKLAMLRCIDVGMTIAGVAFCIHFILLARAGITPQIYLVLAAACFLIAVRSLRPMTRLANFLGGGR